MRYTVLWLDDEPYYVESYADIILADGRFHLIRGDRSKAPLKWLSDPGSSPMSWYGT